jgi:ABC-2 type transport system permease protein
MFVRIWQLMIKEFIQFRRDRLLTIFLITFPALQLVLVARVAGSDITNLPMAILDQDKSQVSRGVLQALDNTQELALYYLPTSLRQVEQLLDQGQAALAVVIPPGFAANLFDAAACPEIQIIADGTNTYAGRTGLNTAEGAINNYLYRFLTQAGLPNRQSASTIISPLALKTTTRFNPELNRHYYTIPAQFAFVVYQVTIIVAALGLVRERELGTLEQLIVTPVRRFELLSGKAIPAIIIGLIEWAIMFFLMLGLFHLPMRGSWGLLLLLSTLFIIAQVSWGMLVSAIARTQQQAILIIFPLAMTELSLSGYLVPVENLPLGLKMISTFSPIRHYITVLRNIMLKGADLTTLWPHVLALVALTIGMAYFSHHYLARRFE